MEYLLLILLLVISMWYDITSWKIPNIWIIIGYILGIGKMILEWEWKGIVLFMIGSFLPVILLIFLQKIGIIGGGDIKLFSVIGGYCGREFVLFCMLYSFLAGAVLALLLLVFKKSFRRRFQIFFHYISAVIYTRTLVPYYEVERDKYEGVMHFSIAILIGTGICFYRYYKLL